MAQFQAGTPGPDLKLVGTFRSDDRVWSLGSLLGQQDAPWARSRRMHESRAEHPHERATGGAERRCWLWLPAKAPESVYRSSPKWRPSRTTGSLSGSVAVPWPRDDFHLRGHEARRVQEQRFVSLSL